MPCEVCILYAHTDSTLCDELATPLSSLSNQGIISDQPTQISTRDSSTRWT
jgi:hypothetical protein